jgi:peptide/nickel transport system permease protein
VEVNEREAQPSQLDPLASDSTVSTPRTGVWRQVRTDATFVVGFVFLGALIISLLLAPLIAPYDPNAQDLSQRLLPPVWMDGGSSGHVLGTDNLGRDVLSRLLYGGRVSLFIAMCVTLLAGGCGTVLGLVAGYRRGRFERVVMGWIDLQVSFPVLLLVILIITVVGPSIATLVICISLTHWLIYARTVRAAVHSLAKSPFVAAADMSGASTGRILRRHVLPNLLSILMTLALLEFATVLLVEAALSFLGLGIQPPHTSWGYDVSIGKEYIFNAWWLVAFPGAAISVTVLCLNLVSSSLRAALDPSSRAARLLAEVSGK